VKVTSGNLDDFIVSAPEVDLVECARKNGAMFGKGKTTLEETVTFLRRLVKEGVWADLENRHQLAFEWIDAFCEERDRREGGVR
jgi:hypothetical protein